MLTSEALVEALFLSMDERSVCMLMYELAPLQVGDDFMKIRF